MPIQDEVMKSRITLIYNTVVNGEPMPKELPLRLMVMGDMSKGSSKDRKVKLAERGIRNFDGSNTNDVIKDMDISLSLNVLNRIDPSKEETINVHLPIEEIDSFSPEKVAQNIPKVRALLQLKQLLKEGLSAVGNMPAFAEALKQVYSDREAYDAFKKTLEPLSDLKIEQQPVQGSVVGAEK
jgi:type VI secretion system protein ImpB